MDLICLEDLNIHYGSFKAFEASEVRLPAGSIGLLGPNGAGKSTLIKVLLGLLRPRTGRGQVLGIDLGDSLAIRQQVGYMPENDSFVPGLTAVQFVSLAGELAGMPSRDALRRAHEVLTYLDLEEARYRKIEQYSAGMKQRFKLAQALVHDPKLLILDEPTNGLDPGGRKAMLNLVRSLTREFGKSVIVATHLLEDVDQICDHLLVLDAGRIVAHGNIEDLRSHWRHRYRLRLDGNPGPFLEALQGAGAEVLVTGEETSSDGDIVVQVPEDWACRRFFELITEVGGTGDDESPVLRSVQPDRESLGQLFRRVVRKERDDAGV